MSADKRDIGSFSASSSDAATRLWRWHADIGQLERWRSGGDDDAIAYYQGNGCRIVVGGLLAPYQRRAEALSSFLAESAALGQRVHFFGLDAHQVADLARLTGYRGRLHLGRLPIWELASVELNLPAFRQLRYQANRAQRVAVSG